MSLHTEHEIEAVIVATLAGIVPDAKAAGPSTPLIGEGAVVDSVGFINLLVALEGQLGGTVDLSTSFIERGDSPVDNPVPDGRLPRPSRPRAPKRTGP